MVSFSHPTADCPSEGWTVARYGPPHDFYDRYPGDNGTDTRRAFLHYQRILSIYRWRTARVDWLYVQEGVAMSFTLHVSLHAIFGQNEVCACVNGWLCCVLGFCRISANVACLGLCKFAWVLIKIGTTVKTDDPPRPLQAQFTNNPQYVGRQQ